MGKLLGIIILSCITQIAYADLTIKHAYVRATPPGQLISAAFMSLINETNQPISVLGASSAGSQTIEIHRSSMENGIMKMRKLEQLTIAPHESETLSPGGLHLMIIGLKNPLKKGSELDIQLIFADSTTQRVKLPIRSIVN